MIKIKRLKAYAAAAAAAVAVAAVACSGSHHQVEVPDRPSSTESETTAELSDGSMRISGELQTLNYDDGGVIFSRSTDGIISAVRLSDGLGFDYDPATPSLKINGVKVGISSAELLKTADATEWHCVVLDDRKSKVYIVVNI